MTNAQQQGSEQRLPEYHLGGQGPWLVLLHGIGGTWAVWAPVLAALSRHYRVIALTLPGHAGGEPLPRGQQASVAVLASRIIERLQALGIARAHVVGNSLGGWLALELVRRGFALSATALSPAGSWRRPGEYLRLARRFRIFHALLPLLLCLLTPLLRFAAVRRLLGRTTMEHAERMTADEFRDSLASVRQAPAFLDLLQTMGRDGPVAPLDIGTTPVCIAWSACDRVIPFEPFGRTMLDTVPAARSELVADAGHVPMLDAPERVVELILQTARQAEPAP